MTISQLEQRDLATAQALRGGALSRAPAVISRNGSFKGANTDKSPQLPPQILPLRLLEKAQLVPRSQEIFWGGQSAAGSLRENNFIQHRPLLTHQMGKHCLQTVNKWKDGCWKREGHIWTLRAFEIPKFTFRFTHRTDHATLTMEHTKKRGCPRSPETKKSFHKLCFPHPVLIKTWFPSRNLEVKSLFITLLSRLKEDSSLCL